MRELRPAFNVAVSLVPTPCASPLFPQRRLRVSHQIAKNLRSKANLSTEDEEIE